MLAPGVTDPTRAAAQMISAQERSASSTTGVAISTDQVTDRARCGSGVMCNVRAAPAEVAVRGCACCFWYLASSRDTRKTARGRQRDRETEKLQTVLYCVLNDKKELDLRSEERVVWFVVCGVSGLW